MDAWACSNCERLATPLASSRVWRSNSRRVLSLLASCEALAAEAWAWLASALRSAVCTVAGSMIAITSPALTTEPTSTLRLWIWPDAWAPTSTTVWGWTTPVPSTVFSMSATLTSSVRKRASRPEPRLQAAIDMTAANAARPKYIDFFICPAGPAAPSYPPFHLG